MLSIVRQIFLHDKLKPAKNYSKEAYCWYHIPIVSTSFEDGNETSKAINEWADKASLEAVEKVSPKKENKTLDRSLVAGDAATIQNDRAVIASSIYLQPRWADTLFNTKDTLLDQEFEVRNAEVIFIVIQ